MSSSDVVRDPVKRLMAQWFEFARDKSLTDAERANYLGCAGMQRAASAKPHAGGE